jgi:hypothetical protein
MLPRTVFVAQWMRAPTPALRLVVSRIADDLYAQLRSMDINPALDFDVARDPETLPALLDALTAFGEEQQDVFTMAAASRARVRYADALAAHGFVPQIELKRSVDIRLK